MARIDWVIRSDYLGIEEETGLASGEFYRLSTVTAFYRPGDDSMNTASRLMWPGDRQALEEVRTVILANGIAKEYMRIPV